ncbi:EAL domain-containing protein [bacterium]|nr:EAL domain-containing protein [bacterium]
MNDSPEASTITVRRLLDEGSIRVLFMPVIDVITGAVFGFELVSRGRGELEYPAQLFPAASAEGLSEELDEVCRGAALRAVAMLPRDQRVRWKFFVNTALRAFLRSEFRAAFEPAHLAERGIPPDSIIIELTDKESLQDVDAFEAAARDAARRGIRLALDDFGSQQSGLMQLVAATPQFIKLDRRLVSRLGESGYRQLLIRNLVQFASNVDTRVVAEGVETIQDVDALLRIGVRYMQGYLFREPQPTPELPPADVMARCRARVQRYLQPSGHREEAVGLLVAQPPVFRSGEQKIQAMDEFFLSNAQCDHVVIVKAERPVGLLTRQSFYASLAGSGAMEMLGDRSIDAVADPSPQIVEATTGILLAARIAMNRLPDHFHDPILLVDGIGGFAGSVSIRALMARTLDLEVQRARDTNPLSGLPGNRVIEQWIAEAYALEDPAIVYVDLDRFKEYNDTFGFMRGDDLIRFTARQLTTHLGADGEDVMVGHVGGDDFVVVSRHPIPVSRLDALCRAFDEGRSAFFEPDHLDRGHFPAKDRTGATVETPLITLSAALIPNLRLPGARRVSDLSPRAARLKGLAKLAALDRRRSVWVEESPLL